MFCAIQTIPLSVFDNLNSIYGLVVAQTKPGKPTLVLSCSKTPDLKD